MSDDFDTIKTDEDVKVVSIKAILTPTDSKIYDLSRVDWNRTWDLKIHDDMAKIVGFATVVHENGQLTATGAIKYDHPIRLSLENGEKVYLKMFGRMGLLPTWWTNFNERMNVKFFDLDGLDIVTDPPADGYGLVFVV